MQNMNEKIKKELYRLFLENRFQLLIVVILMLIAGFVQATSIFGLMPIVDFVMSNNLEQTNNVTQTIVGFLKKNG